MFVVAVRTAPAAGLVDGLATDDRRQLDAAIGAIERAPAATPDLADALFAAAHACEDKLADPVRALAIYRRITHEFADAGVAIAAGRRADQLGLQIGATGEVHARAFAHLVADADRLPLDGVIERADALAAAAWPGAPDVALWLAEHLRRSQRWAEADARYAAVIAKWPSSSQSTRAARGRAGVAIEAHDWDRAAELAAQLHDPALRDELAHAAGRGRARARAYAASWLAIALASVGLLGSLLEASLRGGARRPPLRPPLEIMFLAPIAAVIVAASFTAHQAIAPAVLWISWTGIALAWVSGATLDLLRARGRAIRARAIAHVITCAIGVIAIGYIAVTRDGLMDLLVETVQFGPGA